VLGSKEVFKTVGTFGDYANVLLTENEWRKGSAVYENAITRLYEAYKPAILGTLVVRYVSVYLGCLTPSSGKRILILSRFELVNS
jgi:type I restriction enzyme R subunit